jgi:Asp-tRNA(Asn)/Glu-tRNA(Gln) amidotransferase B subunit
LETNKRIGLEQVDNIPAEEKPPQLYQEKSAEYAKQVCEDEPEYVEKYHEGKIAILSYLIKRVMTVSRGAVNPSLVKEALIKEIESRR